MLSHQSVSSLRSLLIASLAATILATCGSNETKDETNPDSGPEQEGLSQQEKRAVSDKDQNAEEWLASNLSYLEENKAKSGVITTDSGLQYEILREGEGRIPTTSDLVEVHYKGTLVTGRAFDSSYMRGEPAIFPAGQLIPGWVEALTSMPTGSKWRLVIPASLGYGDTENGPIPANSTLVFEMELLSTKTQEEFLAEQKQPGLDYLAENAKADGVSITESGLQFKVLTDGGDGPKPAATDKVKVHYTGRLIDGTVFDSSVQRGEPIVFGLNRVIPGWTEGVQLMSVGDKYEFTIPQELAYGARGAGESIPGFATLVFEVELLAINP